MCAKHPYPALLTLCPDRALLNAVCLPGLDLDRDLDLAPQLGFEALDNPLESESRAFVYALRPH